VADGQVGPQRFARRCAYDGLMVDVRAGRVGARRADERAEALAVIGRDRGTPAVAGVEMRELDAQHGGVQLVEAAVGAVEVVLVLARLTVRHGALDSLR